MVGSFLNVVIHRLPLMLERQWAQDCAEFMADHAEAEAAEAAKPVPEAFNLMRPASHCPHCQNPIAWYHNIPVLTYLALRGRCSACQARISPRYPLVELACAGLFYFCGARWGFSVEAAVWCGFSAALLVLALIDWDTTLLPDDVTLPLMWAGLILSALQWNSGVNLTDAVWGAALGYGSLWVVYQAFKAVTGKEGMGYGDFKLLAALGAWFGWTALLPIVLMASLLGAVVGLLLKWRGGLREGGYVPFGPFLAAAGFTALFWGPSAILGALGLGA
jgi:leader peptidase (prepilin peptidase) / N-methyltransferase